MLTDTRCRAGLVTAAPPARSDDDLLAAIRAGEPTAKNELFVRHRRLVGRVLRGMLGPDPDLEDLMHEVFLRALVGIEQSSRRIELDRWLAALAVFTARDQHRRRRRTARLLPPQELPQLAVSPRDDESSEVLRGLTDVLQRLPEDQGRAFSLRHVLGWELTDVAEACGVSLATIKRRLGAARAQFMTLAGASPALQQRLEESGWSRG